MGELITPSILSAVDWVKTAPLTLVSAEHGGDGIQTWREKALIDLKGQLRRERSETSPAAALGIRFEDAVYDLAPRRSSPHVKGGASDEFRLILEEAEGGEFQKKTSRDIVIDDILYTLYGRIDILHKDLIIDIKTTGKYRPPEYYLKTAQHLIYCYCMGISNFRYRVVVMGDNDRIKQTYTVNFKAQSMKSLETQIVGRVRRFRQFLIDHGLLDDYVNKFCLVK